MNPPPDAIVALSTPTNMFNLPFLGQCEPIPPCTSDLLELATDYENPPSTFVIPRSKMDYTHPRIHLWKHIVEKAIIAEFIVHRLRKDGDKKLSLPKKGSASEKAIKDISKDRFFITG